MSLILRNIFKWLFLQRGSAGAVQKCILDNTVHLQGVEIVDSFVYVSWRLQGLLRERRYRKIEETVSSSLVTKGASASESLEGPDMGVSEGDGPWLPGSELVALDEVADFMGPLVKRALSVLKPEAFESFGASRLDS